MPAYRTWVQRLDQYAAPTTPARAWADFYISSVLAGQGRYRDGRAMLPAIVEQARALEDQDMLWYIGGVCIAEAPPGDPASLSLLEELASGPRDGVAARRLQLFLTNSAGVLLARGERERAEELWGQLEVLAEKTRDPNSIRGARQAGVILATVDGRLEEAAAGAEQNVAMVLELGSLPPARSVSIRMVAQLYLGQGAAALQFLEQTIAMAGVDPTPADLACRSLCLAHNGRHAEAREVLDSLMGKGGGIAIDQLPTPVLATLLETAVVSGDRNACAVLIGMLSDLPPLMATEAALIAPALICTARQLGTGFALLGEPAKARSHYEEALEACERIGFRPEIALTRLQLAELLLEHYPDEKASANQHLDFALAEFRAMKMQPALERALRHKGLLHA